MRGHHRSHSHPITPLGPGVVVPELTDRDLEAIRPPEAEAVTVEVFARWAHRRLEPLVREAGGGELSVRVFESPVAFGGYRAVVP